MPLAATWQTLVACFGPCCCLHCALAARCACRAAPLLTLCTSPCAAVSMMSARLKSLYYRAADHHMMLACRNDATSLQHARLHACHAPQCPVPTLLHATCPGSPCTSALRAHMHGSRFGLVPGCVCPRAYVSTCHTDVPYSKGGRALVRLPRRSGTTPHAMHAFHCCTVALHRMLCMPFTAAHCYTLPPAMHV